MKKSQEKLNDNLKAQVNAEASPTSFQLTLEAPALRAKVTEYEAALRAAGEGRSDIVGVVFVVNGQITGAEVYGSNALFRKAWPKLLNSASVEAVADLTTKPTPSAPCVQEVERFLVLAAQPGANNNEAKVAQAQGNFVGRSGATRGGRAPNAPDYNLTNEDVGADTPVQLALPEADRVGNVRVVGETIMGDRVQTAGREGTEDAVQRLSSRNLERGTEDVTRGLRPTGAQPGNRIESAKCDNDKSLMVESRDTGRGNAVLRRSYIAK